MLTLDELVGYLDNLFQIPLFTDYGPNGLQIQGRPTIHRAATAVTASLEAIKSAVNAGADALIVHHGLFWQGDNPTIVGSKRERIKLLMENDISLLAYHLPMDAHRELGNNWTAARALGWEGLEPFGQSKGAFVGVKGRVKGLNQLELMNRLEGYYEHSAACALGGKPTIHTVALVSGGAYRMIADAAAEGVDAFITGNFDEPAWHLAFEEGINFYAMGHSATERVGPKALAAHLQEQLKIETRFIDINNPF